ncbi:Atu1372/SO_1960 family protein [Aquirufa sp. OSTEICH-129A]
MLSSIFLFVSSLFSILPSDSTQYQLIVGSYTKAKNPGIEVFDLDIATAKTKVNYVRENPNASYQAISADGNLLYSVSEEGGGKSAISAYARNANGTFTKLNTSPTLGDGPCFVKYHEASKTVYVANYGSGSLNVFKTEENGRLLPASQSFFYKGASVITGRQDAPHAHMVAISPDQKSLYVPDLGSDKIHWHPILPDGTLAENYQSISVNPGSGPRHMIFHPNGNLAYVINELNGSVDVFKISAQGLDKIQNIVSDTSTKVAVKASADIHISPNDKWLISSNRITSDNLAIFAIQADGTLKTLAYQAVAKMPRNFSYDPSGKWLFVASQTENKIQVFSVNQQTGLLTDSKQDIQVVAPVCLLFTKKPDSPEERLQALGINLLKPSTPLANYVKFTRAGNIAYLSGHLPEKAEGGFVLGKLGNKLSVEEGQAAAKLAGIALISTLKAQLGDLRRVKRILKVTGFVNSDPSFTQQPMVMNGFSDLMVAVFGDKGKHARSAVGVNVLPNNAAVEVEMVVELY